MTPDILEGLLIAAIYLAPFLLVLCIGGLIADYVFPHIPFIQRFLGSLPEWEDDDEYEEFLLSRKHKAKRKQNPSKH